MATVTVKNGNYGSYLYIDYSFSKNTSARTWSLSSSLKLVIPSGTFGPWDAFYAHSANLEGNGIPALGSGTHTLDTWSTSGNYNANGDAPSVNITWAFNVRSSWAGYWEEYGSITATGEAIGPDGTPPTGLAATLIDAGPDWADISMSISSWGSPSTSATRYIEAAVLGTSTYGNPYKYKTATAVMSETFHVDNTGGGNLTITPNTQYYVGGYATNQTRNARTVGAAFTTLPAVPIINALDQGHGVIDVTVTHANEGSALSITEEYSIDDGATWTTITGGAFSLTLSTQTVLTVRRSSTAGVSSGTVTVAPHFDVAIYASVLNKSKLITKVYASKTSTDRQLVSINSVTGSEYATVPEENYVTLKAMLAANGSVRQAIMLNPQWSYLDVSLYHKSSGGPMYALYYHLRSSPTPGSTPDSHALLVAIPTTGSFSDFVSSCADYGVVVDPSYENAPTDVDVYLPIDAAFGYPDVSKKVAKIYASVAGKTKLVFEDPS